MIGPLGSSPDDLALMMICATDVKHYQDNPKSDAYAQIVPFDTKLYKEISQSRGLRIGYFESLQMVETTPASRRAVMEAVNAIRSLGHHPVPIKIPNEK